MTALPTVEGGRLTDVFGYSEWRGYTHAGIDLAGLAPGDQPGIYAVEAGVVEFVGWNLIKGRNGCHIGIRHSDGSLAFYGHVIAPDVLAGQWVNEGAYLATMNRTGLSASAGIHLHFEIWTDHKNRLSVIDPLPWLAKRGIVFSGPKKRLGKVLQPVANVKPIPTPAATPEPPKEWSELATKQEIKDAVLEALNEFTIPVASADGGADKQMALKSYGKWLKNDAVKARYEATVAKQIAQTIAKSMGQSDEQLAAIEAIVNKAIGEGVTVEVSAAVKERI